MQCMDDFIFGSDGGRGQVMWSEFDGITDDDGPCLFSEDAVAAVMLACGAHIVSVLRSEVP